VHSRSVDRKDRRQFGKVKIAPEHGAFCVRIAEVARIEDQARWTEIPFQLAGRIFQDPKLWFARRDNSQACIYHRQRFQNILVGSWPAISGQGEYRAWRGGQNAMNICLKFEQSNIAAFGNIEHSDFVACILVRFAPCSRAAA
jgi:hypothetical protein